MNRLPAVQRRHQWALPLYPLMFRRLRLPACDLVLSTSSAWAKYAPAPRGAVHVSYIHAPMRFAWNFDQYCERESVPGAARRLLPPMMRALRRDDRVSARKVTTLVANSTAVRDRIRAFWRRDAEVVFPPVAVDKFQPASPEALEDYFVVVSRLVPYKRIDLIVEAFNELGLPLRIAGGGRARAALERMAAPNVRFLGHISDAEVRELLARSRAAVFMSEDDFGITQVEAQAAGRPVIALARGGARDSVVPDVTGVWVDEQSTDALIAAVRRFEMLSFDTERLVQHAGKFSTERFQRELSAIIDRELRRADAEN
jgi:glycosyltransferase involved in cell wall biosynthesis